jgi:hypothetical protein
MTHNNYYTTSISHHLVNTALTKCRLKRKIGTHPIPLRIRVLFIGLGYLARITAKAHGHRNTTRQRQWVEGISGHLAITTIQPISFSEPKAINIKPKAINIKSKAISF